MTELKTLLNTSSAVAHSALRGDFGRV